MAYTLNKTSGAILATVADGTIDTTTDLTLVGKNYAGYGEILNENSIKLLENFANSTAPSKPLTGQIWYDTTNGEITVYSGSAFKRIGGATSQTSSPSGQVTGDLWYDTTNGQLKVYDGATFQLVGPSFTTGSGTSGAVVDTVVDNVAGSHTVVKMYVSDVIVAIISKDASFTPSPAITGFATIEKGYNLNTSLTGALYVGGSADAATLGGVAAANYLRSDTSDSTTGSLTLVNDTGVIIGTSGNLTIGMSSSDVVVNNTATAGDVFLQSAGVTILTIDGGLDEALVKADPTQALGIATKSYVDAISKNAIVSPDTLSSLTIDNTSNTLPGTNNTYRLGSASFKFLEVFATTFTGTSTSAQYADISENFVSDKTYAPGTVVALGGVEEITQAVESDENIFGVISTAPAHLMNAGLPGGQPVALHGRVPVKVMGNIVKGDRLVSAGNGYARAALPGETGILGRALNNVADGMVEAYVRAIN